nr:cytochrome P450 [Bradyrhizobium sp. CCBAU 11357]
MHSTPYVFYRRIEGEFHVAYLPFGIGPWTCIGSSFAVQEAAIVLAVLTRRFEMRLLPHAEVRPL